MWGNDLDWLHRPNAGIPDVTFESAWPAGPAGVSVCAGRMGRRWARHPGPYCWPADNAGLRGVSLWRVNRRPAAGMIPA